MQTEAQIVFSVHVAEEGGYWARAEGHSIFTQGETLDELAANIQEAVECHFDEDEPVPGVILWRFEPAPVAA